MGAVAVAIAVVVMIQVVGVVGLIVIVDLKGGDTRNSNHVRPEVVRPY